MLKHAPHWVQTVAPLKPHHRLIQSLVLLTLLSGCVQGRSSQLELSLQVEPGNRPGLYTLSGSTNLPDRTPITVQGIRYFNPASGKDGEPAKYSILAREVAEVSQGKWQATLNLWQTAPNGQYQEAWQLSQPRMKVDLQPSSEVTFLAVTNPASQVQSASQPLQEQSKHLEGKAVRFTPDGQWYLEASDTLVLKSPVSTTALGLSSDTFTADVTAEKRVDLNNAVTTLNAEQLPPIKQSQTTAALSIGERFR